MLNDFITGLQFLTRLRLFQQNQWSAEGFGRSVKFFPMVGAIIGLLLTSFNFLLSVYLPQWIRGSFEHVAAALLIIACIFITGGLHWDGFMDTMDGIFSGRSPERMLEIMKDSRVGANGVMAAGLLFLVKWSLFMDISPQKLVLALFVMPIIARFAMVVGITCFPYARPEGMGKAFKEYAGKSTLVFAAIFTFVILAFTMQLQVLAALALVMVFTAGFGGFVTR
ncbi:MAG: adenosylcobinamide-GDP ribazoletransferase, partial [Pelosinus sp.]|nr:adenosylcobinamide-GDP ribazoletransferase [Pelosinus sp.]